MSRATPRKWRTACAKSARSGPSVPVSPRDICCQAIAPYGYQWGPERDERGQLLKQRMLPDPVTAPIVERLFREAASGKTLRSIAAALSSEGIPTPATYAGQKNGAQAWDPAVVMRMLSHPTYWGEP